MLRWAAYTERRRTKGTHQIIFPEPLLGKSHLDGRQNWESNITLDLKGRNVL